MATIIARLNPIEKVWQRMKEELKKLPYVPTSLKKEVQTPWDRVDHKDFRCYTEKLTCKLDDVIEVQGLGTIH